MLARVLQFFRPSPAQSALGRLSMALVVGMCLSLFATQFAYAWHRADNLTENADAYSEANEVRAAQGFAERGFSYHAGLPTIGYGHMFDAQGGKFDPALCPQSPDDCVYLHYPPGAAWIAGLVTKIEGRPGALFAMRMPPLLLWLACLLYFAFSVARSIGAMRAAFVLWFLYQLPMFSAMMHGIEYHSYTVSLCLVQIGVLLRETVGPKPARARSKGAIVALAILGFLQGWMSFEYGAMGLLLVPAVLLLRKRLDRDWARRGAMLALAYGFAFALANVLHFAQVVSYLGGVHEALTDFSERAKFRVGGATWVKLPIAGRFGLLVYYWFDLLPRPEYYNGSFVGATVTGLWLVARQTRTLSIGRLRLSLQGSARVLGAVLCALLASISWLLLFPQHGGIHSHFIPRHHLFFIIVALVAASRAVRIRLLRAATTAAPSR
jgi:hypothetical protein